VSDSGGGERSGSAGSSGEVISPESEEEVAQAMTMLRAMMSGDWSKAAGPATGKGYTPSTKEAEQIKAMLGLLDKLKK